MLLLLAFAIALVLHIFLGWQWSIVGGFVAGVGARRFGWFQGLVVVALSWAALVVYNFSVAPAEMSRFVEVTSELLGNMEGPMLVGTTILLGALLGLLGGAIGALVRSLVDLFRSPTQKTETELIDTEPDITNIQS